MDRKKETEALVTYLKEETKDEIHYFDHNFYHVDILEHAVASDMERQLTLLSKIEADCTPEEYHALRKMITDGHVVACMWLRINRSMPRPEDYEDDGKEIDFESIDLAELKAEIAPNFGVWREFTLYAFDYTTKDDHFYPFSRRYRWYLGDNHEYGYPMIYYYLERQKKEESS